MERYVLQDVSMIFRAGHVATLGLVGLLAINKFRDLTFAKADNQRKISLE